MSTARRPDEDFAAFKLRQKAEARAAKLAPYMAVDCSGAYRKLPTGQLVSEEEGVTRGRARTMKYKAAALLAKESKNK